MQSISIRTWVEPFPSNEGVAVVFDVFRCSTTIHSLVSRGIGPVFVAPSLKEVREEARLKGMRVFSELSQPVESLARFDNSPHHALGSDWDPAHPALVATTTGTPAMFAARRFKRVYVGSLVNFSSLITHLSDLNCPITLIPATFPEAKHVEDDITAQAMATALEGFANMPEFVHKCGMQAREQILACGRVEHLRDKLSTGAEDTEIALSLDRFPQVLYLDFQGPLFAEVKQLTSAEVKMLAPGETKKL
jgi:phosphosulfolactate phosphohydrolase-like enzyme